jgi:hypothetical protein
MVENMALLFCDGFDHYDTAHLMEKWDVQNNSPTITIASPGRNIASTYNNYLNINSGFSPSLGKAVPNSSTLTIGFAINPNMLSGSNFNILAFQDSTQTQVQVLVTASA